MTSFPSFDFLAWSFKVQIELKDWRFNKKVVAEYAHTFWSIQTMKGNLDCPFPDYLVKYVGL